MPISRKIYRTGMGCDGNGKEGMGMGGNLNQNNVAIGFRGFAFTILTSYLFFTLGVCETPRHVHMKCYEHRNCT